MLVLSEHERDEFHVLAYLGGGRLVRIRARRFKEEPAGMCVVKDYPATVVDGGDIRLWMQAYFDENLESPDPRARQRGEEITRGG